MSWTSPHRRTGKLVVATRASERSALEDIAARAEASGAGALSWLDAAEVRRREPRVRAHAGLWSPRSGIVDAHALAASYRAELESLGGAVALHTRVAGLEKRADGWSLRTESSRGERFDLEVPRVVNAAGLWSDRIAELAGLDVDALGWRLRWCKGDYFGVAPRLGALTRHLVYPVPAPAGLGIHVTLDLGAAIASDRTSSTSTRSPTGSIPPRRNASLGPRRATCRRSGRGISLPNWPASGPSSRDPAKRSATS